MKVIAVIEADFNEGALGTRSRLAEDLAGEPVLRRTLRRALEAEGVSQVHLAVRAEHTAQARSAAEGLEVQVETHEADPVPWRGLIASGRKWSLDAWRGGLGGTTVLDESMHPWVLNALAERERPDAIVSIPPGAALLDPNLLSRMIQHFDTVRREVRMTFTQSAPGLSASIYLPELLSDLAEAGQPFCRLMAYNPSEPKRDMVMQSCFYSVPAEIANTVGRCIVDTQRSLDRVTAILQSNGANSADRRAQPPDAAAVSSWLRQHRYDASPLPAEVEIELTTEPSLPDSTLRPRGEAVGRRGPMETATFERLIQELSARDDVRVVLGGFGDPLLHPEFPAFVRLCRSAGIFGLALRTPAVHLEEPAVRALIEAKVDVLNVLLDANRAETYRRVHHADHYDRVIANIERVLQMLVQVGQPQPLVICEMTKTHATMDELEPFYDHWTSKTGSAVIVGPSTYGGQWPDLAVMRMAPPARFACQRIFDRATVLADGKVTVCDQDFHGSHAIGSIADTSLSSLWTGPAMETVRRSHLSGGYDGMPLCPTCEEWHRP